MFSIAQWSDHEWFFQQICVGQMFQPQSCDAQLYTFPLVCCKHTVTEWLGPRKESFTADAVGYRWRQRLWAKKPSVASVYR